MFADYGNQRLVTGVYRKAHCPRVGKRVKTVYCVLTCSEGFTALFLLFHTNRMAKLTLQKQVLLLG